MHGSPHRSSRGAAAERCGFGAGLQRHHHQHQKQHTQQQLHQELNCRGSPKRGAEADGRGGKRASHLPHHHASCPSGLGEAVLQVLLLRDCLSWADVLCLTQVSKSVQGLANLALRHCSLTFANTAPYSHHWYQLPIARLLRHCTAPEAITVESLNSAGSRADSPEPGFRLLWRRLREGLLAAGRHPTVRRLAISGFGWDDEGLSSILDSLASGAFRSLTSLDLSHNCGTSRDPPPTSCSLHFLCSVLLKGACPNLTALHIHDAIAPPHRSPLSPPSAAAPAVNPAPPPPPPPSEASCAMRLRELEADVAVVLSAAVFPAPLLRHLCVLTLWGGATGRGDAAEVLRTLAAARCTQLRSITLREVEFRDGGSGAEALCLLLRGGGGGDDGVAAQGSSFCALQLLQLFDVRVLQVEVAELRAELPGPRITRLRLNTPRHRAAAADASAAALLPSQLALIIDGPAAAAEALQLPLSSHFAALECLDLSNCLPPHLPSSPALLRAAAAACPRLAALTLAGNDLGAPGAAQPVAEALSARRWPLLSTLMLNATDLEDGAFASLCSALAASTAGGVLGLRRLEVRCCGLTAASMTALRECAAGDALPELTHLDVSGNAIGDAGAAALAAAAVALPRLSALLAMGCDIAAAGLGAIVAAMRERRCPRLRVLHLCCNQLLRGGAHSIRSSAAAAVAATTTNSPHIGSRPGPCARGGGSSGGGGGCGAGAASGGGFGELREVLARRCCPELRELWLCGSGVLRRGLHTSPVAGLELGSCGLCGA